MKKTVGAMLTALREHESRPPTINPRHFQVAGSGTSERVGSKKSATLDEERILSGTPVVLEGTEETMAKVKEQGTQASPWALKTPPGTSDFTALAKAPRFLRRFNAVTTRTVEF